MVLSLIIIPAFLFGTVIFIFGRRRDLEVPGDIDLDWGEISLFERHGTNFPEGRIETTLHMGCEKLGLPNAILTIRRAEHLCVQNVASLDGSGARFVVGQMIPADYLFCGMLDSQRNSIAIDHAGLSEWHRHRAHTDLGWQAYMGVRRELSNGDQLNIAFYHDRYREQLFSAAEKNLVNQLGNWVAAMLEKERQFGGGAQGEDQEFVARA